MLTIQSYAIREMRTQLVKHYHIGMRIRRTCPECEEIFQTKIIDKKGNTANSMCRDCKTDEKWDNMWDNKK